MIKSSVCVCERELFDNNLVVFGRYKLVCIIWYYYILLSGSTLCLFHHKGIVLKDDEKERCLLLAIAHLHLFIKK